MTLTLVVDSDGYLTVTGTVDDPRALDVLEAARLLILEQASPKSQIAEQSFQFPLPQSNLIRH
jgi:hypothetical protein